MRGIAAARAHEAQQRLPGIRASAATVGAAIGDVLAIATPRHAGPADRPPQGMHLVVVLCAEQGFVGSFNEHILDRAQRSGEAGPCEFLLVGTRGIMAAQERGLPLAWSAPMVRMRTMCCDWRAASRTRCTSVSNAFRQPRCR